MIGLVVFVGLLSGADCLSAGVDAARRKDWGEAFRAFRAARAQPGCDTPPLLFNLARAGEKVVDNGDGRLACEVAERYAEFMDTEPAPALAKLAVKGRSKMARICAVRSAPPEPRIVPPIVAAPATRARTVHTTSNTLEWGLTTGAVVTTIGAALTYALALGRIDERDAASNTYLEVRARGDTQAAADAQLDFEQHRDAARTLGVTSYVLGGTALALTGLAIWAWVEDDDAAGHAIITPGYLGWGGRF